MINIINGLSKQELRMIKNSLVHLMLDLNKDLKKSIKNLEYDEITIDIQCLDDYSRLLNKLARNIRWIK